MSGQLFLYSFFHLNMAFSSIEEEARAEVVERCYWPLLRLIDEVNVPIGVEASGYTLETINAIDSEWVAKLKHLFEEGKAEFIGSGYAQLIGPLVPAKVNQVNQDIGLMVYEKLLGFRPEVALVNEQAYSSGLVPIYRDVGYRAIIMEWDNPASAHPEWNPNGRFLPQRACAPDGSSLPVIWNLSIPFQKFQRYAHGELSLEDYLNFLGERVTDDERTFALYGNDAEIFDFRPGRFHTETSLIDTSEWERIGQLYEALECDDRFSFLTPSEVLGFLSEPEAGKLLNLESAQQPIPVKKQPKYNITRWALTGRGDLDINTRCWRIYENLLGRETCSDRDWKDLCYLWSSDFRTHITGPRWVRYLEALAAMESRLGVKASADDSPIEKMLTEGVPKSFSVCRNGAQLEIETSSQKVRLNCRRGLVIDGLWHKNLTDLPLVVTLAHGYFDDILFGADFYTGHYVFEAPGQHKVTDLVEVVPELHMDGDTLCIRASIESSYGLVTKELRVASERPELQLSYHFSWARCPNGTLRLGHITLNPELFSSDKLFVETHNGGCLSEKFYLDSRKVNHLIPVSGLVSAQQGLGITEGVVQLGDDKVCLKIETDKCSSAVTGHILFEPIDNKYLCRLIFSAMEIDETAFLEQQKNTFCDRFVRMKISSSRSGASHAPTDKPLQRFHCHG